MDLRKHLDESIICQWAIIRQQANHDCGFISPAASQAFWPTSSMQQGRPLERAPVTFSLLTEKEEKGNLLILLRKHMQICVLANVCGFIFIN